MNVFYIIVILGVFASACSQLLLKFSADKGHKSHITEFFNWRVMFAYAIFLCSMFVDAIALGHGVRVKDMTVLEALGYVFVPLLSWIVFKEHLSSQFIISLITIVTGVIIFYL